MNFSAEAVAIRFDANSLWVTLRDGRVLGLPLAWFPRLLHARPEERMAFEISPRGLHWDQLDEDISIAGLLAGLGDQTHPAHPLTDAA